MKTVAPEPRSKSRRCCSIPEAELEEAVAPFGTDESFVEEGDTPRQRRLHGKEKSP